VVVVHDLELALQTDDTARTTGSQLLSESLTESITSVSTSLHGCVASDGVSKHVGGEFLIVDAT